MQRYFIHPEQIKGTEQVVLVGDDVHHIKNVMRGRVGTALLVCAGDGWDYLVEIVEIGAQITCRIVETTPSLGEPRTHVTIAQSMPKGEKWEWILQKGTEIGATSFLPFSSERTVVKIEDRKADKKIERWERIVKEAAEQAHRGAIPAILPPHSWKEMLAEIRRAETAWIAYEKGGESLADVVRQNTSTSILLLVGPEGGFSEAEVAEAVDAGAIPITLGSRILRTETAPLAALSCILFANEDFGR